MLWRLKCSLGCRGIYWLTASPWALARETGVVERVPHANDVWVRLRLWSRSAGRAHSPCRSHTPVFLHVYSCFLLSNRGQEVLSVLFASIASQIVPLLIHTTLDRNEAALLLSQQILYTSAISLALTRRFCQLHE